jgi:cytochrome P450
MSNKDGCFLKTKITTRVTKLLFGGVAILDAEKWAKHRRILNPAFHTEKLKVLFFVFFTEIPWGQSLICDV